jgi:ElaB/YqjD/DUF883 family membrane-anchored ribosome-binding protein
MHSKSASKSGDGAHAARTSAESSLASARRRLQRVDRYVAANRARLAKLKRA